MSLAYCFDCLKRIDNCTCGNPSNEVIYGELRVAYEEGRRDEREKWGEKESQDHT